MRRLVTLFIAFGLLAAGAPAAAAPPKSDRSPAEVAEYWTPERIKSAKPRERARPGGGGGGGKTTDWTRYTVPTPYVGETAKNGKLFFRLDGQNYVCSGTAVDAADGINLVWTAGHCLTDGVQADGVEHKATNILFMPGYLNGEDPAYGRWAATGGADTDSTEAWELSGGSDFRYDVAAARVTKVEKDANGDTVTTNATFDGVLDGGRPIVFTSHAPNLSLPLGSKVVAYGYPAAGKFNGQQQYACASTFRKTDTYNPDPPAAMQIGCDMTGGSSGGGWILDNGNGAADPGEPIVSVNSYGYSIEKNTMYGPQMLDEDQAELLYRRMSGLAPQP